MSKPSVDYNNSKPHKIEKSETKLKNLLSNYRQNKQKSTSSTHPSPYYQMESCPHRERERETERERERERLGWFFMPSQPGRQTDRQTQRKRERETDRDRQRQTETETDRDKQTDRQRQRETQTKRDTDTETDRHTERDRYREIQRETETDRQTETERMKTRVKTSDALGGGEGQQRVKRGWGAGGWGIKVETGKCKRSRCVNPEQRAGGEG